MNFLFRVLLTSNATSLLLIIYSIKESVTLLDLFPSYPCLFDFDEKISYSIYIAIPIFLTWASIKASPLLSKDSFEEGSIVAIEHANNSFLPSYLGYFFVALSINNPTTLLFVYGILFVFTFLSQALYFNPLFLLFGFDFYNIRTKNGAEIFLISKNKYKKPAKISIEKASRINDYTYLEG